MGGCIPGLMSLPEGGYAWSQDPSGGIHGRYTPTSHLEGTSDQAYPPPEGTWNQAYPPPPVDRMTDTSENIAFP